MEKKAMSASTLLRMPASYWDSDTDENEKILKTRQAPWQSSFILKHQAEERMQSKYRLEAPVKLTWFMDGRSSRSDMFAYSEINTFAKLKSILRDRLLTRTTHPELHIHRVVSFHIDRFVISFMNLKDERINSEKNQKDKKYNRTGTEYSDETFTALMKANAAETAVMLDKLCACNQPGCKKAERCTEIKVWLSELDARSKRSCVNEGRSKETVKIGGALQVYGDNIVRDFSGEKETAIQDTTVEGRTAVPRTIIDTACLRKLLSQSQHENKTR